MFKHINTSRLGLLLRIWWLERNAAILEDQANRVWTAQHETDIKLHDAYTSLRQSLPAPYQLPREVHHG